MAYIDKITSPDPDTFPGALFQQAGEVPEAQCQETKITNTDAALVNGSPIITEVGAWPGIDLAGKEVVVSGTVFSDGTYGILSNTDDTLTTDNQFAENIATADTIVQDVGQTYLRRNIASFARFISAAGYAYTIKGGKLYTDCPDGTLSGACSDTWNPEE